MVMPLTKSKKLDESAAQSEVGVAAMSTTLVADIGGSKSRFALSNSSGELERVLVIDNDTVAGLDAAVAYYLEETGARPRAATLAVAGSVGGEEVVLTNRVGWRLRRAEFAKRFGFLQLRVLNDFEAVAWALPLLGAAQTRPLGEPVAMREGVKVVLGPGTGLGVAALLPANGRWHVLASEGGHASFGPQRADEVELFTRLRDACGSVSAEAVLSGPGLVRLLGRFAGGLALTFKALGGVYITGGVACGLGPLLDEPQFRAAFEAHPPYATLLKTIPTLLITCEQPGLIGCAAVPTERALTA